jgi:hypothetical protein
MRLLCLCLALVALALAQDTTDSPVGATTPVTTSPATPKGPAESARSAQGAPAPGGGALGAGDEDVVEQTAESRAAGGNQTEECEEAWEYLEFLKTNIK